MDQSEEVAEFRNKVYLLVKQIPTGRVTSYGRLAEMIPKPDNIAPEEYLRIRARWVGRAMRAAPKGLPWHRVINSQGKISLPAGSRGAAIQRKRLETEGINFDRHGKIDLSRFGWRGPGREWLADNNLIMGDDKPQPVQLDLF